MEEDRAALEKAKAREAEQPAETGGHEQHDGRRWTSSLPQVASEDIIDIGNGRYAHFRRDRRFAQVQVAFTAPEGVDPNPGRELTDQFKEMGWTWRPMLRASPGYTSSTSLPRMIPPLAATAATRCTSSS